MTLTPPPPVPRDEYRQRQLAVAGDIARRGLDGLLVWSSCGSALDANAFYLTNHNSPVPRVNVDIMPFMTGWGQTAVVITAAGDTILVSENGDIRDDLIVTGTLMYSRDVYGEVVAALRAAGLAEARIGLAGASWQRIQEALPQLRVEPADDVLFRHRMLKSHAEIALMRHASEIGCEIQNAMLRRAEPGARDLDLAVEGMSTCLEHGAVHSPRGRRAATATGAGCRRGIASVATTPAT
jgi:Xaa-Pro aminopeptidase